MTTDHQTTARTGPDAAPDRSRRTRYALRGASAALAAVIVAPVLLSSQDLFRWAESDSGLGLPAGWAALVPIALDLAAVAMICMTVAAALVRERPGIFEALVWVFALVSAYAQYRHGMVERDAGRAQDAWWFFPALALLGPVLMHVTLSRTRRWARKDSGEQHHGAAGFGARWLPGVAFRETLAAWAASRKEGITRADDAIAYVRERSALAGLSPTDALHYAFGALNSYEPHAARVWLASRSVVVGQAAIDEVTAGRPVSPLPVPVSPAAPSGPPAGAPDHAATLAGLGSNRERIRYAFSVIGRHDRPAAVAWLAGYGVEVSRSEVYAVAKQAEDSGQMPVLSVLSGGVSGPVRTTGLPGQATAQA